jgi:hypothetical protein
MFYGLQINSLTRFLVIQQLISNLGKLPKPVGKGTNDRVQIHIYADF